jgi:hypothetical protein
MSKLECAHRILHKEHTAYVTRQHILSRAGRKSRRGMQNPRRLSHIHVAAPRAAAAKCTSKCCAIASIVCGCGCGVWHRLVLSLVAQPLTCSLRRAVRPLGSDIATGSPRLAACLSPCPPLVVACQARGAAAHALDVHWKSSSGDDGAGSRHATQAAHRGRGPCVPRVR